ncbi:MAG: DUF3291 domain-containing protein [Arenicellales bacterium]|jgi:hypothetical protein
MSKFQLVQLNIAKIQFPLDCPEMADFVNSLERINTLADQSPGFVWRLQTEDGDATSIDYFGNETIVNMSIWNDIESLHHYVYRSDHAAVMSRRKQWFEKLKEAYNVLWWVPLGHVPGLDEASERLLMLRCNGPTPDAFTFKRSFTPEGDQVSNSKNPAVI